MARSQKKLPYVDYRLMEKINKTISKAQEIANTKGTTLSVPPIKTYARNCTIIQKMVGLTFHIHNGKKFIPFFATENSIGHKLGEFSPTRTFGGHPILKKDKDVKKGAK